MKNEHDSRPLSGKQIVVTRRKEQAGEFSDLLKSSGARVIQFPAVEIVDPPSWSDCDDAIGRLPEYSGIIFTSRNAAMRFFSRAEALRNLTSIGHCRLFAVGEKTQRTIEGYGFQTVGLPEHYSAEELARNIAQGPVQGEKFLFPKGNLARADVKTILGGHGAVVDEIVVYHTVEPQMTEERRAVAAQIGSTADMITFFSPSGIEHTVRALSLEMVRTKTIAVFGSTTAEAAAEAGLTVGVTAPQSTIGSLVQAIVEFYSSNN